ncbi:TetR/AcrR family transcriptional regulator [Sporomusa sphaeroides]|uniref:TetR/AcrR family transcriptional regulator n=1 Tax=Sporomusa sphaeroides TaxID=47679 RepID=UPI002BD6CDF4|nr:helix-turn-helix domain-containing protein [Sporomusa sphaeroides]HML32116.1 helix-turn-helix domain-containing protein [Sporomusa sphaeroides]
MQHLLGYDGKKGEILKASLSLFAAKGYDAVSVRDIAKAAGVSEAALYKHFKGKEDMALYIFTVIISDYTERIKQIECGENSAVSKLCRIVEITYDLYREYPAEIRFALLSQYSFWDLVDEEIKPHFVIRKILEEGMEKGEIPRQEVYFWIIVFTGIMLQPLNQYPYFHDALPEFDTLKTKITSLISKLFS